MQKTVENKSYAFKGRQAGKGEYEAPTPTPFTLPDTSTPYLKERGRKIQDHLQSLSKSNVSLNFGGSCRSFSWVRGWVVGERRKGPELSDLLCVRPCLLLQH